MVSKYLKGYTVRKNINFDMKKVKLASDLDYFE